MEPNISPSIKKVPPDSNFLRGVLIPSLVILVIIAGGLATGWFIFQKGGINSKTGQQTVSGYTTAPGALVSKGGKEVGSDKANFKDTAEGILKKDGIDGEGTHHLERTGGVSQNVYLTSSVLDLDQFIDKKVQVSGETFSGKKAGWLMDVGKVKVLD